MKITLSILCALTLIVLLIQCIESVYITKRILFPANQQWNAILLDDFGYEKGGQLTVSVDAAKRISEEANLVFAMMPYDLFALIVSARWDSEAFYATFLCDLPMTVRYPLLDQRPLFGNYTEQNILLYGIEQVMNTNLKQEEPIIKDTIETLVKNKTYNVVDSNHYAFTILRCDPDQPIDTEFEVNVDITAINPNGQHLSSQSVPYILMFFILSILYFILNIYWWFKLIQNRQYTTNIHHVIMIALVAQNIAAIIHFVYYQLLSGMGSLPLSFIITVDILSGISEAFFLMIMLLLAMGWTITIDEMGSRPRHFFFLSFGMFLTFRILYSFCRQPSLCPAYVLSFRVIKFLITFAIIIALNQTVERLRIQTAEQQFMQNQSEVFIKLKMLKSFRIAFFIYLIAPITIVFIEYMVVSWVNLWVLNAINELVVLYINYAICSTFNPKPYNVTDQPDEAIVANAGAI